MMGCLLRLAPGKTTKDRQRPMILELVEALKGRILYFVSLTTDPTPTVNLLACEPAGCRQEYGEIDTTNANATQKSAIEFAGSLDRVCPSSGVGRSLGVGPEA